MKEKKCGKCEIVYPATSQYFIKSSRIAGGLANQCKKCVAIRNKNRYDVIKAANINDKKCKSCGVYKPRTVEYFKERMCNVDGFASRCNECIGDSKSYLEKYVNCFFESLMKDVPLEVKKYL